MKIKKFLDNILAALCVCGHKKTEHASNGTCNKCPCEKYAARGQDQPPQSWG